jgi:redox-sensitive bicupin YhaK (pirin superfamily)
MPTIRKISRIIDGQKTSDGAGVSLLRVFGFYETGLFDPFLLLDFFGSENPNDYIAGFPWHPHRGIETVTYMLEGSVEHGDSMGNSGVIHSGDIQWMTAGSGIIHQEMPKADQGYMHGFQLWVNLPAKHKMMAPRYQEIKAADIPVFEDDNGALVKVIAGEFNDIKGPVKDIIADPVYFDVSVPENTAYSLKVNPDYTVFAFVFEGEGFFDESLDKPIKKGQLVKLTGGDQIKLTTTDHKTRFILVSGKPLNEPVAWRGPIVMNTDEELDVAFREYRNGTFIK